MIKALKSNLVMGGNLLDSLSPQDFWNGENPGHYGDAVALSKIAGIQVAKTHTRKDGLYCEEFVLHAPRRAPHRRIPICSPEELIFQIKRYVEDYPDDGSEHG